MNTHMDDQKNLSIFLRNGRVSQIKKQPVMCDVGGGASVGRVSGRIPETRVVHLPKEG